MPNVGEVSVRGLREMHRAFAVAEGDLDKRLRASLKKVAEPVRADAASRALHEIRNIHTTSSGPNWSEMRTGVTTKVVYVAPTQRGRRGRAATLARERSNTLFADRLMDRAMQPALDAHTREIERELDNMLDDIATNWGRGG